jgi:hypothetical protein
VYEIANTRRSFVRALAAGGIGAAAFGSGAAATRGTITVEGGGEDIWNAEDQFHFYYTPYEGDFDVTVHVDDLDATDEWAKAGIMVRQRLIPGAENAMLRYTAGNGTSIQWRSDDGDETDSTTSDDVGIGAIEAVDADWLRLVREGDVITGYGSANGEDWTRIAELTTDELDMSENTYVGLAVTSHDRGTLTAATFDSLSGVDLTENDDVGDVAVQGSVSIETDDAKTIEPGTYRLMNANSGKALDVAGLSEDPRANVYQWEYLGNDNQHWQVEYLGDGQYRLTAVHSGLVADIPDASGADGASLQQWGWAGSDNQRFEIEPAEDDTYLVRAVHSGKVLDAAGAATTSGTDVLQWRENGGAHQRWQFVPVDGTGGGDGGDDDDDDGDDDDGGEPVEPASQFSPDAGFASTDWFDDDVDVYTITEPTREALEEAVTAAGPRVVVFETSGTIDLGAERLSITEDNCWIAGQTAPSPGITLIRGDLNVDADDCVVQHLRVRPGDAGQSEGWEPDSVRTADGSTNNVLDHVSASWSVDEVASAGYDSTATTMSNCLVAEPLHDATHSKGSHGYGSLIGDGATDVALLGNVWAKARGRQPRLKDDTRSVLANNVMYHFDEATNLDGSTVASIEGNAYLRVDEGDAVVEDGSAYVADNYTDPKTPTTDGTELLDSRPLWPDGLERLPSDETASHAWANVGARPADRTAVDERLIAEVQDRTGENVDSQTGVGGYPDLAANTHSLSVPDTDRRRWLQQWARAVERADATPP